MTASADYDSVAAKRWSCETILCQVIDLKQFPVGVTLKDCYLPHLVDDVDLPSPATGEANIVPKEAAA